MTSQFDQGWSARLWLVVSWVFVIVFAMLLAVAFGLALSKLDDSGVLCVGVAALAAGVVGVGLQGMYVSAIQEAREAAAYSDPENLMGRDASAHNSDRFAVLSYSLTIHPDVMSKMQVKYAKQHLHVSGSRFIEAGYITCAGSPSLGQVNYSPSVNFLVVGKTASSRDFQADVMRRRVTSVLVGGDMMRIVYLTHLDFDTSDLAGLVDLATCDVYALSFRGGHQQGAVPGEGSAVGCVVTSVNLPWDLTEEGTASGFDRIQKMALNTAGPIPIIVWGIGGR